MKTIILPGYSPHNKEWAEETARQLTAGGLTSIVHYWKHWEKSSSTSLSLRNEIERILEEVGDDKFNLIAKSVGTRVVASLLLQAKNKIGKIILCGIPSTSSDMEESFKKSFGDFPAEKIICFQNTKDPFKTYGEIKNFLKKINPKIKVIEKERSDHHYPYYEDFKRFLKERV